MHSTGQAITIVEKLFLLSDAILAKRKQVQAAIFDKLFSHSLPGFAKVFTKLFDVKILVLRNLFKPKPGI